MPVYTSAPSSSASPSAAWTEIITYLEISALDQQYLAINKRLGKDTKLPFPNPTPAYLNATTKIDISGLPFDSSNDFITDGKVTVTFDTPLIKRGPVPTGWDTWSSPPFSESANPDVLFSPQTSLTMTLSNPVRIFGFELEPDGFGTFTYTADFYFDNVLKDPSPEISVETLVLV